MINASGKSGRAGAGRTAAHLAAELVRRVYAAGMIALVGWLSIRALWYLLGTLMFPTTTPEQIVGIPKRLTEDVLQTHRASWQGMQASDTPRAPLAHYHRMDTWFQPDAYNNCTVSGCHEALPHSRNKSVRAFLNMHATTLHCAVCHMESERESPATVWYDLRDGRPRSAPTLLQLYAWLESDEGREALSSPSAAAQERLAGFLRAAAGESESDPALVAMAERADALHYGSAEFQQMAADLRTTLPMRFRGEYGVKLARRGDDDRPLFGYPNTAEAVRQYLSADAGAANRRSLLEGIHAANRKTAVRCVDCHDARGGMLDFAGAGYPPARVRMLSQPIIFRMIGNIADGRPFYLPGFVAPREERESPSEESRNP